MNRKTFQMIVVVLFSVGWLIPMYFAVGEYAAFWYHHAQLASPDSPVLASFPHMQFAVMLVRISIVWLGLALAFWSYAACSLMRRQ